MAQKHSNFVRLSSLQVGDLPEHAELPLSKNSRPELDKFFMTLVNDGLAFLSAKSLADNFSHHSTKPSPPSSSKVEVLTYSIPAAEIGQIEWSDGRTVERSKPRAPGSEHWFARKSIHRDVSSKSIDQSGSACWDEFVYGLRDNHSEHEAKFDPSLYDARPVLDWKRELGLLKARGQLGSWMEPTLGIYEMSRSIPGPLSPRAFSVLVGTASVDEDMFIAVTVPVSLNASIDNALYSVGRNIQDGETAQQRKEVVMGVYAAVETVRRNPVKQEIEWIMATASDARGNLPMWLQRVSLPSQLVKDVGNFLKWIQTVDDKEMKKDGQPSGLKT
ncbi:hypothetical protein B0A52_02745 [Exophiala mesophila]|uniref:DUF3074 domain-containing protein n=1 Tax=Exophiala mesophila TaxID=212818 RepID=A0A438NDX2_EXOME|nr:hypothetical protein B0A52_02745 [Exophiala mesophila]